MPVTGETHLRKGDYLDAGPGGFVHQISNASKVVSLVTGSMLKLDGCHSNVAHEAGGGLG
jgi:hypothetical protein